MDNTKQEDPQKRYVWIWIDWKSRALRFSQPAPTKYGNDPPLGLLPNSLCMGQQECIVPWPYEDKKISKEDPRVRELFELYSDFSRKVISPAEAIGGPT